MNEPARHFEATPIETAAEANSAAVQPGPSAGNGREEMLGIVSGDRACAACGYNLTGQVIVRDPHYGLPIVRCTECGVVAALQEYPALGKWANRWAGMLAAAWFLVLIGVYCASFGSLIGMGFGAREIAGDRFADWLGDRIDADIQRQAEEAAAQAAATQGAPSEEPDVDASSEPSADPTAASSPVQVPAPNPALVAQRRQFITSFNRWSPDPAWVAAQDFDALFAEAGGWRGTVDWRYIRWIAYLITVWCAAVGVFWSNALLHLRRGLLPLVAAAIVALPAVIHYQNQEDIPHLITTGRVEVWELAQTVTDGTVMVHFIGWTWLMLTVSMLTGRPILRGLIRMLLPPRLRVPLSFLWTSQGLKPPGTGAARKAG